MSTDPDDYAFACKVFRTIQLNFSDADLAKLTERWLNPAIGRAEDAAFLAGRGIVEMKPARDDAPLLRALKYR